MSGPAYDAVVLAGGAARRLGGLDKPALRVGGRTLLDAVLAATVGAERVIVVGPRRPTATPVRWTRERPPGSGPVAAADAGIRLVTAELVALLAADLPFLDAPTLERLRAAVPADGGAVLVDETGREQWLIGMWQAARVRDQLAVTAPGASLGALFGPLHVERVHLDPNGPPPWVDCDTPGDIARAKEWT